MVSHSACCRRFLYEHFPHPSLGHSHLRTPPQLTVPILPVELIGYIGRAASAEQTPNWTLGPYIVQSILLLIAPALFAASIYMGLGRIILLVDGEDRSLVKKKWLTKLFVIGDILSFQVQASGKQS